MTPRRQPMLLDKREPVDEYERTLDFSAYRTAVSQAVVALDVHSSTDPDLFRGRLDAGSVGDIHVLDIAADGHAVHRTPALIARAPQHYLKFSVIENGSCFIIQDGRESALTAGDMVIYDTDRPYSLLFDDVVRVSVVMFPKDLLNIPADVVSTLTGSRLDRAPDVGALVRPFVSSLARSANDVSGHVARRLFRTATDMVGTLLEAHVGEDAMRGNDQLMRRILDYIAANLGSAELSPSSIAAAHYISVRHLHALFSQQGTTVSTVIRTRRLERCYDELVNPLLAGRSVTTIALDNGFIDAAHFSRTFRAHFGVPPSSVRPQSA